MPRSVESRILTANSDLSTGPKQTKNRLFHSPKASAKPPVELVRKPTHYGAAETGFSPISTRLEAQIPSAATTCRKSGSFARGDVYLTASYHRGKGTKTNFGLLWTTAQS